MYTRIKVQLGYINMCLGNTKNESGITNDAEVLQFT